MVCHSWVGWWCEKGFGMGSTDIALDDTNGGAGWVVAIRDSEGDERWYACKDYGMAGRFLQQLATDGQYRALHICRIERTCVRRTQVIDPRKEQS